MAALPPSVAVKYTSPGLVQTAAVFFVGNLFANFLLLVAAIVVLSRYLHVWGFFLAAVVAYYATIAVSKAHKTGGLQSARPWIISFLKHTREYFDLQQIHEGGLKADEKYIFCCHPHGIHGFGTGIFMDDSPTSEFYNLYPFLRGKVVGLVATVLFFIPLVRELFLSVGTRDASRQVAESTLEEGNSIYLIVGGEAESLRSLPGTDEVVAAGKGRKGFVRLALRKNALLVPVYMYHNTDTYQASRWLFDLRCMISKKFQVCLPLWWGRFFTPLPFNIQLTVALGKPVVPVNVEKDEKGNPTPKSIDEYHAAYLSALEVLFEKHKLAAGYPADRKLQVVESE